MSQLYTAFTCLLFLLTFNLSAQVVLQIERAGSAKTKKIFIGERIEYKLKGGEEWEDGVIERLIEKDDIIVFADRFIKMEDIEAIRYFRPWTRFVKTTFFWFGVAWSGFAAIGTAVDGNDDTQYRWSDAIITATSLGISLIIPKIFKYKVYRFGKRKRLRILDISFKRGFGTQPFNMP